MWPRELQSVLDPRGRIWGPNTAKKGMEGQNFSPPPTLVTESPGELGQRSTRQGPDTLPLPGGNWGGGKKWRWKPPELPVDEGHPTGSLPQTGPGSAPLGQLLQVHTAKTAGSGGPKPRRPPVREVVSASPKTLEPAPCPLFSEAPPGAHAPQPSPPNNQSLPCA